MPMTTVTLRALALPLLLFTAAACGGGRPPHVAPLPASAREPWTTQPGDMIRISVWREPELTGEVFVQNDSTAIFPALGRIRVGGLTADSLNAMLVARFSARIINTPVDARLVRPLPVVGSVRSPGVYPVDATSTTVQVIARAGGTMGSESIPRVQLLRFDGTRLDLSGEQSLGMVNIRNGDALFVQDQSWFLRNQRQITAAAAVSTILASAVTIALLLAK
jgi:protein involved in polysaccharide export with SLBB domain